LESTSEEVAAATSATTVTSAPRLDAMPENPMAFPDSMVAHSQTASGKGPLTSGGSSPRSSIRSSLRLNRPSSARLSRSSSSSTTTHVSFASLVSPSNGTARTKRLRKPSRYLTEKEKLNILSRIEAGETQAALARAFGVTRAAICYVNKNREDIITRSDMYGDELEPQESSFAYSNALISPRKLPLESQCRAIPLLMTILRDRTTRSDDFRLVADRVMSLLLEEALAACPVRTVEYMTPNGHVDQGPQRERPVCAVSIDFDGSPFTRLLQAIEPKTPSGKFLIYSNNWEFYFFFEV